jgi:hypothetical protein
MNENAEVMRAMQLAMNKRRGFIDELLLRPSSTELLAVAVLSLGWFCPISGGKRSQMILGWKDA